jgi:hypothetical protein
MHVHWHRQFNYTRCVEFRAVTSVLRLGGGGGWACFARPKGRGRSRATFRTYHFSLTFELMYRNLYNFQYNLSLFCTIYQNFPYNYYFSINYVTLFAQLHIFCPTSVSLKLLNLPYKTAILQYWGVSPPNLPCSYGPGCICISAGAAGHHWFWRGNSARHPLIERG